MIILRWNNPLIIHRRSTSGSLPINREIFYHGKKRVWKITLSGRIGMIWATEHIGTGTYSFKENQISSPGFIAVIKIFRTFGWIGINFAAIVKINSKVHYFGGIIYILIEFFR